MDHRQLNFSHLLYLTAHHWRLAVNRRLKNLGLSQASWVAVAAIVEPLGGRWELEHHQGAPPVVNHPWAVGLAATAARAVVGPDGLRPMVQSAGGEDFAWYGDLAPLCYLRLGVRGPGAAPVDLHAGTFDVDEAAVAIGARLLAGAALEALADLSAPTASVD